jgi:hypothetical protein
VLAELIKTHEGRCAVAEAIARGDVYLTESMRLPADEVKRLMTLSRNPCVACNTFQLQFSWLGSGFCSLGCLEEWANSADPSKVRYAILIQESMAASDQST